VQGKTKSSAFTRVEIALMLLLSAPFWAAAAKLGWDALHLPEQSGRIAWIQLWEASVFSLGLAVGLAGSALALGTIRQRYRGLGLSLVLLGTAAVTFAFVRASYLEERAMCAHEHVLPFVIPAFLLALSLATLLESLRTIEKPAVETEEPEPTSGRQLPLSLP